MSELAAQALRFGVVGIAASGTHYATYLGLVGGAGLAPVPATVIGFCLGTLVSYALNARFTFAARASAGSFARFWLVTLVGGGVNTALVWLSGLVGLHFAIGGLAAIVVGAAVNFAGHRWWTFRRA